MDKIDKLLQLKPAQDAVLWFQETWIRLRNKSPKYFRTTGLINMTIGTLGSVPDGLRLLDITLPPDWMLWVGRLAIAAGWWAKLNLSTTVARPVPEELVYTEKKHIEQEIKDVNNKPDII